MNLDPSPPVRPLLTHVIADGSLQREAGISRSGIRSGFGATKPKFVPEEFKNDAVGDVINVKV